jgi:hypothetical protein
MFVNGGYPRTTKVIGYRGYGQKKQNEKQIAFHQ